MHHLNTDPAVEVTADLLEKFAAEHGGPIEIDNATGTAHWDHPNLPIRYFAHLTGNVKVSPGVTIEVSER